MNRLFSAILILFFLAPLSFAQTGEFKGVVELFTSQGCSSCPPADEELARLAEEGEVLALSYHVDYWNFLGWKDTLSDPDNTARQYGYAATWDRHNVYTPQAVINGLDHVNGADDQAIRNMVDGFASAGRGLRVGVSLTRSDGIINVDIAGGSGKAEIVMVYFDKTNTVKIGRGENEGRTVTYHHSVRDIEVIGMWSGKQVSIKLPESVLRGEPGRGCAILLQTYTSSATPGEIIGAAAWMPGKKN